MTIKQDMTSEYRQLQYELQCQEALLVLMQKLRTNQRMFTQANNIKQRTTTTTTTATKQPSVDKNYLKIKIKFDILESTYSFNTN
jgi:hypothetical protein